MSPLNKISGWWGENNSKQSDWTAVGVENYQKSKLVLRELDLAVYQM